MKKKKKEKKRSGGRRGELGGGVGGGGGGGTKPSRHGYGRLSHIQDCVDCRRNPHGAIARKMKITSVII